MEIFDFYCDDWEGTIPYSAGFKLHVRSVGEEARGNFREEFSGLGLWECSIKDFRTFVRQLEEMYEFHVRQVELADIGYGGKLSFELDRMGHICIRGTVFGVCGVQSLTFEFTGDQTSLGPFIGGLKEILGE